MIEIMLIISNIVTAVVAIYLLLKSRKPAPLNSSLELEAFMRDLLNGNGIVRVERIAPEDVLIHHRRR